VSNPYAPPDHDTGAPPEGSGPAGRPTPPVHHRPVHPRPAPPPQPVRPPDPEAAARARNLSWTFSLLLLASILTGTFPVPWVLVSVPLIVATLVVGVRAVAAVNRAGATNGPLVAVLAVGICLCLVSLLGVAQTAVTWDLQLQRQRCVAEAITVSAQTACAEAYEQGVEDRLQQLQRTSRG